LINLRQTLLQPQQQLNFFVGSVAVVTSPPATNLGAPAYDCRNGPKPIHAVVKELHGAKTAIVHYRIETWINECRICPNPLLGNRWSMEHDIDDLFYTTRTITGTATFRSDLMQLFSVVQGQQILPDEWRNQLAIPCPDTFRRTSVNVKARSDGLTLDYVVVDEEQTLNLGYSSAVQKVKGTYHQWKHVNSLINPSWGRNISIEVWGERLATRNSLLAWAMGALLAYQMPSPAPGFALADFILSSDTYIDIVAKYVKLDVTVELTGLLAVFVRQWGPLQPLTSFPESLPQAKIAAIGNPAPPASNGMRGNYLEALVTQVLTGSCLRPAFPPTVAPILDDVTT
jgi:hypothetical protein